MNLRNVEFQDVHRDDAPDYADAFIAYAEHMDGTPLTDDELDIVNDDRCLVGLLLWDYLH